MMKRQVFATCCCILYAVAHVFVACASPQVDIYAFGLIMYFMSSGKAPFHELGPDPEVILLQYRDGKEPRPTALDCHTKLRPIMMAAWHVKPSQRPNAQGMLDALDHVSYSRTSCGPCAQM